MTLNVNPAGNWACSVSVTQCVFVSINLWAGQLTCVLPGLSNINQSVLSLHINQSVLSQLHINQSVLSLSTDQFLHSLHIDQSLLSLHTDQSLLSLHIDQSLLSLHVNQFPLSLYIDQLPLSLHTDQSPLSLHTDQSPLSLHIDQSLLSLHIDQSLLSLHTDQLPLRLDWLSEILSAGSSIHPGDGVTGVERVDHGAHCRQGLVQVESVQGLAEQMVVPLLFIQRLDGSLPQLLTLFVQCTGQTGSQNGRNLIKLKAKSFSFWKDRITKWSEFEKAES